MHSDHVFLFTQELMKEHGFKISELDAVLVSNGPGSYTGLRIAASSVKGMLFGTRVNLYEVNTLAGFAQSVSKEAVDGIIHAVIDARRIHVYHQAFKSGENLEPVSVPSVIEIAELEKEVTSGDVIVGTGLNRISKSENKEMKTFGSDFISASSLISLFVAQPDTVFFNKTSLEELNPNYITSSQVNNSKT